MSGGGSAKLNQTWYEGAMRCGGLVIGLVIMAIGRIAAGAEAGAKQGLAVEAAAQDFIELLRQEKFGDAVKRFDATMTKALPVESLRSLWQTIIQQNGALKRARRSKT